MHSNAYYFKNICPLYRIVLLITDYRTYAKFMRCATNATAFLSHHCFTNLASGGLKRLKCLKFIYTLQFPQGTVFHKLMRLWSKASLLFLAGALRHSACCSALFLSSPVQIINTGKYIIPLNVGAKLWGCQG